MKKTFTYEEPYYGIEVVLVGVFCILVCISCIVLGARGVYAALIFAIVAFYQVWNTFISLSNPQKVTIDEEGDEISFSGFGRTDSYRISGLDTFLVRAFPSSGKTYIRVGDHGIFKGRYWVPTKMFTDGQELFQALTELEYRIHPDSLKARARNVNQEYLDHADQIDAVRKRERARRRGWRPRGGGGGAEGPTKS